MKMSLAQDDLVLYVARQVSSLFPDGTVTGDDLRVYVANALERLEYCFSHINIKYFFDGKETHFNHLHTDQYAMFLYFLCNVIYRTGGDLALASKVYGMNKALHSVDIFYEVALPEIFAFQHPVGTVLGRGTYSNYFFVYQRCSIGSNLNGDYPTLGEGVVMFGGSGIIGNCTISPNCWLSVGTLLADANAPPDSLVFGQSPHNIFRATDRNVIRDMFLVK